MVDYTAAIGQNYANMLGMSDLYDNTFTNNLNFGTGSLNTMSNPLSMYGSTLGTSGLSGLTGLTGLTGMTDMSGLSGLGMYGFNTKEMQEWNSMTTEQKMNKMYELQSSQLESQTKYKKQLAGEQFKEDAANTAVDRAMGSLQRAISEKGDVPAEYNKFISAYKRKLVEEGAITPNTPEDQVQSQAEEDYANIRGISITDDLKKYNHSEFGQGIIEGLGCGIGYAISDKKSAKDKISGITGEEKTNADKTTRIAGRIFGGVLTAAAVIGLAYIGHRYHPASELAHSVSSGITSSKIKEAGECLNSLGKTGEVPKEMMSSLGTAYKGLKSKATEKETTHLINRLGHLL